METNEPVKLGPRHGDAAARERRDGRARQDRGVRLVLTALVCGGHVLLEDVPGTAKTVLARAMRGSVEGAAFSRIQCTPDLQPTDVTGLSVFNQRDRDFEFRPGPVFANVLLVDEINRAMPKTQSALLEAMAEQQVTIDGTTRELPEPFLVLATENPIEQEDISAAGGAARPLLPPHGPRVPLGRRRGRDRRAAAERASAPCAASGAHARGGARAARRRRDRLHRPRHSQVGHPARSCNTRSRGSRSARPCAAASRSSERRARGHSQRARLRHAGRRGGALPRSRHASHRLHPELHVASAREVGWQAASDRFRDRCMEIAPRPGAELEPEEEEPTLAVAQ